MPTTCSQKMILSVIIAWGFVVPTSFGQEKPALSAEQALRLLKKGNEKFVADMPAAQNLGAERRRELAKGQNPFAIVLTCADSRVTPEFNFNQGLGDIFVLRVAGNIADPFELGSIEYAVEHLQVPLVVILGHEKCGAVEAALGEQKPAGNLGKLIDEIHVGSDLPKEKSAALAAAVKNNARNQAETLTKRSEVIKEFVEHKRLQVVSGVYSLTTGKVEWLEDK
jgi:carbonic anhydrase